VCSSGGVTHKGDQPTPPGLSRTLFTQAVIHIVDSSAVLAHFYRESVARKGCGRARIALIRKIFSMMRRRLLSGEPYRWVEPKLYERKFNDCAKRMKTGADQEVA